MEAVSMIGGAILSPLVDSLLEKFSDLFTYAGESKVMEEVSKWKPTLETIFAVLDDAEEQRMTDMVVKSWFNPLRDLAYDVDDVLDELITHAARRQFYAQTETPSTKFGKLLHCGLNLSSSVKFSSGMVSKVKNVSQRLEKMKTQMDLPKNVGGRNTRVNKEITARPPMSSLVEQKVRGREEDHKAILDMIKTGGGDGGISVICIVGMGGVGKTTLAQMVYESLQVDFKAWVPVGEDFDLITVTKTIVQLEGDLDKLQSKLREKLSGKKFVVVLDDLWSADYDKWTRFYLPFASGAPGSIIIITTRINEVSLLTSRRDGYTLKTLLNDDSLCLFTQHALGKEDFSEHMDLREVGQQIIKRCNGLPLALKLVGGILRGKPHYDVWEKLLENRVWGEDSKILPALRLSYFNLPPHLKRCFTYCAVFPKEYEFTRDELVLLWLGEGFLQELSQGYDYFDALFSRSVFQKSAKDASIFLMHDLINDLARSVNEGVCLNLDEEKRPREACAYVRHLAYNRGKYDIAPRFESFQHTTFLRTLLALPIFKEWKEQGICYISSKILDDRIPKLKLLRVLSLSGYKSVELPKSVSVLQHLRYLNLCCAEIVTLPASMSKLFNLQVLILCNCKNLRKLPEDFTNLINLQCVDLRGTESLEEMPLHIGKLQKLQILTKFIVCSNDGCGILELLKIPNLRGHVHVKELQNVVNMDCLRMKEKEKIDELILEWSSDFDVSRHVENEKQVLEALQPQKNVAMMSIKSYGGMEFPSWFGRDSFKMTVVEIHNCRNVSSLPPLGGLPSLKELSIQGMPGVKEVGVEFYGLASSSSCSSVFPSLETLSFKDMKNWKSWCCSANVEHKGQLFPKLRVLGISRCPELVGDLPKSLHSLEKLEFEECKAEALKRMPKLQSLISLKISHISGSVIFNEAFPETFKSLQKLHVEECDELHYLWENGTKIESLGGMKEFTICSCEKLVSLVEGEEGVFPPNLQLLQIRSCHNLERLPNELHSLKSLTALRISGCQKLRTFGDLPENVKKVQILGCGLMERLGEGIIMVDENGKSSSGQTSYIEELTLGIREADSLVIPPNVVFPPSLRRLSIYGGCRWNTQLLGEGIIVDQNGKSYGGQTSRMEELSLGIREAVSLVVPLNVAFPSSLRRLYICGGWLDAQLLGTLQLQNHLSNLTSLVLEKCLLESFPSTGLPIPTLLKLSLLRWSNLRRLPCNFHNLTSLKSLTLSKCKKVECFPGGMPPNLSYLDITFCDTLQRQPLSEWRLNQLTSLQNLTILGDMEMVYSFPHDSLKLPTLLTYLYIGSFKNLKSISSSLQTLTSLRHLTFSACPKLQYLPKEGLPPSLERLSFSNCPLMKKQCKTKYRSILAHIPYFKV